MVSKFAREAAAALLKLAQTTADPELAAALVRKAADLTERIDRGPSLEADVSPQAPDVQTVQ